MSNVDRKSVSSLIRTYGEVNPHAVVSYMQQYQQIEEEKGREEEEEIMNNASILGDLGAGFVDNLKDFRIAQASGEYDKGFFKFMAEHPKDIANVMEKGQAKIDAAEGREKELLTAMFPKAKARQHKRIDRRDDRMSEKWGLEEGQKWSEMSFKERRAQKKKIRDARKDEEPTEDKKTKGRTEKEKLEFEREQNKHIYNPTVENEDIETTDIETADIEEPGEELETTNEDIESISNNKLNIDNTFGMSPETSDTTSRGLENDLNLKEDLTEYEPIESFNLEEEDDGGDLGGGYTDDELEEMNQEFPWEEENVDWEDRFDEDKIGVFDENSLDGINFDSGEFDEDLDDLTSDMKVDADNMDLDEVTKGVDDAVGNVTEKFTYDLDNPSFADLFKNSFGF